MVQATLATNSDALYATRPNTCFVLVVATYGFASRRAIHGIITATVLILSLVFPGKELEAGVYPK